MESPVLSSAQMQAAEQAAFARGTTVEALMGQAGTGVARAVRQFFPKPGACIAYAGKGHNGGDALVAAEQLQRTDEKKTEGVARRHAETIGHNRSRAAHNHP